MSERSEPLIVKFGAGVDSTGMLCAMIERGVRPDAVIFADTGGERDHTYANVEATSAVLVAHGFALLSPTGLTLPGGGA